MSLVASRVGRSTIGRPDSARTARVAADDVVAEGERPIRQGAPDPPDADDAESLAGRPADTARQAEVPDTVLDAPIQGDDAARQRQDETESVIGDLVHAVVRDVPDRYPEFCCGDRVDGVEPDPVSAHGPDCPAGREGRRP